MPTFYLRELPFLFSKNGLSLAVALLLGAMASMVMDRLDHSIQGGEDAEIRLKKPVLAAVPAVPGTKAN